MKWLLFLALGCTPVAKEAVVTEASVDCAITSTEIPCARLVSVYDGDTFTVTVPSLPGMFKVWSVRVRGIDTPEVQSKNACERRNAAQAKALATEYLSVAKRITLKNVGKDKYFRLLADVEVDDADLKSLLLESGLAVAYNGKTKPKFVCTKPRM